MHAVGILVTIQVHVVLFPITNVLYFYITFRSICAVPSIIIIIIIIINHRYNGYSFRGLVFIGCSAIMHKIWDYVRECGRK